MTQIDLGPFGFEYVIEIRGMIKASWSGGRRLVFLLRENHRDREMKWANVLDACTLAERVAGVVGTEVPMAELDSLTGEEIVSRSRGLFDAHKTDEEVMAYLSQAQPWWYGGFGFGNTLKLLRPSLPVWCVEDPGLRAEMTPISDKYQLYDLGAIQHPFPDYPNMGDHPHNLKREKAMIDNTIAIWDETAPALAAILNTGADHAERIAAGLQERGISYITVTQPSAL